MASAGLDSAKLCRAGTRRTQNSTMTAPFKSRFAQLLFGKIVSFVRVTAKRSSRSATQGTSSLAERTVIGVARHA